MTVSRALFSCMLFALAACSHPYASRETGIGGPIDPSARLFAAQRRSSWTAFRLGGGLNVVVENPGLPRAFAWRLRTGSISSSPVVYRDTILIDDNDHHLYAIDAATGAMRWRYTAENELMPQPLYQDGLVYVATGNSDCSAYFPPHYVVMGLGTNRVEAIDAATGREVWSRGIGGTGMPTGLLFRGTFIHADGSGALVAFDARTGAFRWRARTPSFFSMGAVVNGNDGEIFIGGAFSNAVYAFDARTGGSLWTHAFPAVYGSIADDPLASTANALVGMYLVPLAAGPYGMVVQDGSRALQHVYALDKRTGHILWDRALDNVRGIAPAFNESAIPLVYRGRVYVGSAVAPIVTALDVRTGRVLWQRRVNGSVKGGLAAWNGVVYFGDIRGYLWALDAATGRVIGHVAEGTPFNVGSPIIVNETLVDGSQNGVLAIPLRWIRESG